MSPNLRWVLLLAFVLRSLIAGAAYITFHFPQVFYAKDTWSYLQPAIELMTQGSFTAHGEPELFRTPGYALLLGAGIKFGQIELTTIALQILLSCATTYIIFCLAKLLFDDERAAMWSAFAYSLEPLSIIACSWLLSETLFTFLLASALWSLIKFAKLKQTSSLYVAAIVFAAAAYVRPIGYFLPFVIAIVLLLWSIFFRAKWIVAPTLWFVVIAVILLGAWQVRNYRQTGYAGFSVAMAYNLYFHQTASLSAKAQQRPFYEVLDEIGFYDPEKYLQSHPEQRNWTKAARYEFMQREGIAAVWREPLTAGEIYLRGLIIAMVDPGAAEYLRLFQAYPRSGRLMNAMVGDGIFALAKTIITQQPLLFGLSLLLGLWLLVNYVFAVFGLRGVSLTLPLLLVMIVGAYQIVLAGGTLASGRFRMPAMMVVCMLAGHGFASLRKNYENRNTNNLLQYGERERPELR